MVSLFLCTRTEIPADFAFMSTADGGSGESPEGPHRGHATQGKHLRVTRIRWDGEGSSISLMSIRVGIGHGLGLGLGLGFWLAIRQGCASHLQRRFFLL